MTDDLAHRIAHVEAVLAIQQLAAEYAHGADRRDLARFLAVWHPDGVWDVGPARFVGREQIGAAIERQWADQPRMHHWTTNHAISVDLATGTASGLCDVAVLTVTADDRRLATAGSYRDVYRRDGGRWLIAERRAEVHGTHPLPS
jgi:ketosteroid isomerase-like protein